MAQRLGGALPMASVFDWSGERYREGGSIELEVPAHLVHGPQQIVVDVLDAVGMKARDECLLLSAVLQIDHPAQRVAKRRAGVLGATANGHIAPRRAPSEPDMLAGVGLAAPEQRIPGETDRNDLG